MQLIEGHDAPSRRQEICTGGEVARIIGKICLCIHKNNGRTCFKDVGRSSGVDGKRKGCTNFWLPVAEIYRSSVIEDIR